MDELKNKLNGWVLFANEQVQQYDKVIENFLDDLQHQNFVSEVSIDKTPKQPKKKRNVLSTINDSDNLESNESVAKINEGNLSLVKKSLDSKLRQSENNLSEPQAIDRPVRAAKGKACANLKEPSLVSKMRCEVKLERISSINNISTDKPDTCNETTTNQQTSTADVSKSASRMEVVSSEPIEQGNTENRLSNNKKLSSRKNTSIEILPLPEVKIELLSDDEKERMPPPAQPPPKTKKKTKGNKSNNISSVEKIIPASEIKEEKLDSSSSTTVSSKENTRPKRTKGKGKQNTNENDKSNMQEKQVESVETVGIMNATVESVYEDAISDANTKPMENNTSKDPIKKLSVVLTKISASDLNTIKSSGIDVVESEHLDNITFNMNITRTVNPGDTFITDKEETNSTFVVPKTNGLETNENQKENGTESSLITDDESGSEESNIVKPKNSGKNEIFNPLIQSPVRKKVQAFEQHAAKNSVLGSPAATRVTRIKSRIQDVKENRDTNTPISRIPKPETPNADPKPDRYYTPKETTSSSIVNLNLKKKYNSTSKLHGMGGSSGGLSSKSSTSRDNSVEDLKRGASALQFAAEEKKRKREEKQKHAQQIREAKEREKREAAERIAREKQEKCKKYLQEREEKARQEYEKKKLLREHKLQKAEIQKNLEEIQKNLQTSKYMEQKREEQSVQEIHKKKLNDMKERDLLDVARMNAMRDEINRNLSYHIQGSSSNSKPASKQKKYDFDLLLSGDSTDEEDKQTTKKPPPPTWSLSKVRQPVIRQQNYIQWKIVDKLFSVQPMTIDLQEIFPTIDSRYLKRNSSVIWSTPPRYSELPKY